MFELKLIEKEFKCANEDHKEPVEMVIWDTSLKKEQRLICKQCQLQQSRAKPLIAFTVAYERALEKQKKLMEQISPTIQANQNFLKQLQEEIQNLKAMACKTLDGLLQNTKEWQENLHQVGEKSATFSLHEVLDKMITSNEQYASEEQIQILETINNVNNAFFHKVDSQLNNFFLFKEYPKCQQSLINVIVNLNDFTQANIQLSQDNNLNNTFFKSKAICREHKKEIIFVNLEENVRKDLRSACRQCNRRDGEFLDDFIDQWKDYNQNQNNILQQELDKLKIDIEKKKLLLNKLRLDYVNKFSKGINQLWEILLKGLKKQFQTASNLQMLVNEGLVNDMAEKLCKKDEPKKDDLQYQIRESISNLKVDVQNCFMEFNNEEQQIEEMVVLKSFDQNSLSIGMAFNQDGSKLITSSDSNLILWSVDKKEITKITTLSGHNDYINCVLFNNRSNGIISGCEDSSIRIWKENIQNQWDFVEAQQHHQKRITCLVLNSKENQLFSGSCDSQICVWNIDFEQLKISFHQKLQYHVQDVYSISLNQQNTYLVSCSFDQKIVIWEIQQNEWKFKQLVQNQVNDFGYRVSFLNENMFIWVSANELQGSICVFQLEDERFVEKNEKKIELTISSDFTDCMYFPIVYNNSKNVAYVKHKKHLYVFKVEEGKLNLTKNAIELQDNIFGTISNNGQNLIIFNLDEKKLQFIQIKSNDL